MKTLFFLKTIWQTSLVIIKAIVYNFNFFGAFIYYQRYERPSRNINKNLKKQHNLFLKQIDLKAKKIIVVLRFKKALSLQIGFLRH